MFHFGTDVAPVYGPEGFCHGTNSLPILRLTAIFGP